VKNKNHTANPSSVFCVFSVLAKLARNS